MAFKFVIFACALAVVNGSYINSMGHHYGSSSGQYGSQDQVRYSSNSGSGSQGVSTPADSIIRHHSSSLLQQQQQKQQPQQQQQQQQQQGQLGSSQQNKGVTSTISSSQFSSNQGKSEVGQFTSPATFVSNGYNSATGINEQQQHQQQQQHQHQQQIAYSSTLTPQNNYNHQVNGYENSASPSPYDQSTPVYGHAAAVAAVNQAIYGQSGGQQIYGQSSGPASVYPQPSAQTIFGHSANSAQLHGHNSGTPQHQFGLYHHGTQGYLNQGGNTGYSQPSGSPAGTQGLIGVSYLPAVAVSHMSYSSPVGVSYAW